MPFPIVRKLLMFGFLATPFTLFIADSASEVRPVNLGIFNRIKIVSLVTAGVAFTKRERSCVNGRAAMRAYEL